MRLKKMMATTAIVAMAFLVVTPAHAGWIVQGNESNVGGRILRADAETFVNWGREVRDGVRRRATVKEGSVGRAGATPVVDHLCLRSTFRASGGEVDVQVDSQTAQVTRGRRWVAVTFPSCGQNLTTLHTTYPKMIFKGKRVKRVVHILRVAATNADPGYAGTYKIRRLQEATDISGDPKPGGGCEV